MSMGGSQTLRGQLLLRMLTVSALLLMVLGISQYALLSRYLQNQAADGIRQRIRTAFAAQASASGANQPPDASSLVRTLGGRGTAVRILDSQGAELAAEGPSGHDLTGIAPAGDVSDTGDRHPDRREGPGGRPATPPSGPDDPGKRRPGPSQQDAHTQVIDGQRWLVVAGAMPPWVVATAGSPAVVLVAQSLHDQEGTLRFLAWLTLLAGAAGLILAAMIAYQLMGGALRPLTRLVEAASSIAGGDWERRVAPGGSREIDEAASSFNRMVDRLQVAFAEERSQHERMRRFLADAAHELRTPLTALNGFVELMQAGAVGDPTTQQRALGAMRGEGERMARLIRDLLQIARLESPDHGALPMADLDLAGLLHELHPVLNAADPIHPIDLQAAGTATIRGNADGLKQVVWNLVDNARRYSPPEQPVMITCRSTGDQVLLAVTDKGRGIPPEDLQRVFERFWRGDASRQRATGGTGLGLAIVQALVEAHRGQIRMQSDVGRGTTVKLSFPRLDR
jgi:two-component system, OmpR family, sensor kinase